MMNGLVVIQNGQFYSIYTPQGIQIAQVFMGADGQISLVWGLSLSWQRMRTSRL